MRLPLLPLACLVFCCQLVSLAKAEPEWAYRVGAASIDITPEEPIRLSGYGNRVEPSTGVALPIHARAVVIESVASDLAPVVLINVEVCGIPQSFTDHVCEEIEQRWQIPQERVVICATHTHAAPWLLDYAPNILQHVSDADRQRCREFEQQLVDQLVAVTDQALQNRQPAALYRGEGEVAFARNRRVVQSGTWSGFGVSEGGPVDHRLPVLVAKNEEGKPIAIVSNYACHCTTTGGDFNQICGDWAGFAQQEVEADFPHAIGISLIGCGADANPEPRGTLELCRIHGHELAAEVQRVVNSDLQPVTGEIHCQLQMVALPLEEPPSQEQLQQQAEQSDHAGARARYFLEKLQQGETLPDRVDLPVATWAFGEDLLMIFLGGEVVVDYDIALNDVLDGDRLWITAYANAVPCYIPSQRILREGGYEADSSMIYYRQPNRFAPEVEPTLLSAVQQMAPVAFQIDDDDLTPTSPESSHSSIQVPEGLKVELVASEPLIADPVAFDWGVDGKLWVVEMGDYPNGIAGDPQQQHELDMQYAPDETAQPGGRIKFLRDTDNDGQYDEATLFLEGIPFPTGIQCWRNGVIITAAPDILYAEDTDGDGRADIKQVLLQGFGEGNQQHRVNGLRWGLDNWLYVGNGDSGGEIESVRALQANPPQPTDPHIQGVGGHVNVAGRDLRIRPDQGWLEAIAGQTQFGRESDDWGNWFGNNNSRPLFHYVFDESELSRNPFLSAGDPRVEVPEIPGAGPVYPISHALTRFNDLHTLNHFTSACSSIIYRDSLLGEQYSGNSFTCEPVHNLVSRAVLVPQGPTFSSHRADEEQQSEFLAARDSWFRPVMIRTGPDGALWVADMTRLVIEHPRWIPEEWKSRLDIRAGAEQGRIYRILPATDPISDSTDHSLAVLPRGMQLRSATTESPAPAAKIATSRLVAALDSPNGWQRDTAQRLLVHRQDPTAVDPLTKMSQSSARPQARLHALWTLQGLNALTADLVLAALEDEHPAIRRAAIQLSESFLGTYNVRQQVLNRSTDADDGVQMQLAYTLGDFPITPNSVVPQLLAEMATRNNTNEYLRTAALSSLTPQTAMKTLAQAVQTENLSPHAMEVITAQATYLTSKNQLPSVSAVILQHDAEPAPAWQFAALARFIEVLNQRDLEWRVLAESADQGSQIANILQRARQVVSAPTAESRSSIDAIRLLSVAEPDSDEVVSILTACLLPTSPPDIQLAAADALSRSFSEHTVSGILNQWPSMTPSVKTRLISAWMQHADALNELLQALEAGTVTARDFSAAQRDQLRNHPQAEIQQRAGELLGRTNTNRSNVIAEYSARIESSGNTGTGRVLFEKHCASCHRLGGVGKQLGADLAAVKDKSSSALLMAILDPNRAVEARYLSYAVLTNDGRVYSGMIRSEASHSVTLLDAAGQEHTLLRADIEEMRCSNLSYMPEGLEKELSPADLSDLMEFLRNPSAE